VPLRSSLHRFIYFWRRGLCLSGLAIVEEAFAFEEILGSLLLLLSLLLNVVLHHLDQFEQLGSLHLFRVEVVGFSYV
jgi:hypothetical protein